MRAYELSEVGELCGVHQRTVEAWVASGELLAFKASRNRNSKKQRLRVLETDLQRFIESRKTGSTPERSQRRGKLPAAVPTYF